MSLPITPVTIAAASRLTAQVVNRLADALDFDTVLRGDPSAAPQAPVNPGSTTPAEAADLPASRDGLLSRLGARIRQLLAGSEFHSGSMVSSSVPIEVQISARGETEVTNDHPQAAAIEAMLEDDADVRQLAQHLTATSGPAKLTLDLRHHDGLTP